MPPTMRKRSITKQSSPGKHVCQSPLHIPPHDINVPETPSPSSQFAESDEAAEVSQAARRTDPSLVQYRTRSFVVGDNSP